MALAPPSPQALRLPAFVMTLFFSYACAVQANDPDSVVWMSVYGLAAAASLCQALNLAPATSLFASLAAVDAALVLFTSVGGHELSLDVDTECGRETGGLSIVLLWNMVLLGNQFWPEMVSPVGGMGLLGLAATVAASAVLVPTFMMHKDKLVERGWWPGVGSSGNA